LNHRSAGYEPAGMSGYPIPLPDSLRDANKRCDRAVLIPTTSIVGSIRSTSVLDAVNFEDRRSVIESTRKAVLPDAEFLKRSTGERLEVVTWITPL
jgi:hypothetical protein